MSEYWDVDEQRAMTWQEALRHLLDSRPTDQQVADFMAREEGRFRRWPDQRREAEQMVTAARPPWVRPLYERAVQLLVSEGKKPTDALVAERMGFLPGGDDGARTVRRWRRGGLLR